MTRSHVKCDFKRSVRTDETQASARAVITIKKIIKMMISEDDGKVK